MINRLSAVSLSLLLTCGLTACSGAKEKLGLTRSTPDEFAVIKRAPLVIPSNLVQLPVPQPGAPRPQEKTSQEMAAEALFGPEMPEEVVAEDGTVVRQMPSSSRTAIPTSTTMTESEAVLLQQTGATQTNPQIRQVVDSEAEETTYEEQAVIDKILNRKVEAQGSVIDPQAEAQRLKANQAAGRPLNAGDVRTVGDDGE